MLKIYAVVFSLRFLCGSSWGFYIVPPCEPDALVVVEAVDEDKNNIQHLAVPRMPRVKDN